MTNNKYICALTIAGSDPSGGAGIQADLKTFSALGCYGMSVLTALTAQNTQGVQAIAEITSDFVLAQLQSIFQDITIDALKIGMLHNEAIIKTIAEFFRNKAITIILDPVMTAKDGSCLLQPEAIAALKKYLLPCVTLITPNIPEATLLLQHEINTVKQMEHAAIELAENYQLPAVLIKGGHLKGAVSNDCLYFKTTEKIMWLEGVRVNTKNTHGTGCTLSTAITAFMAKGDDLETAATQAKAYVTAALQAGAAYQLGLGIGPVHHFYQWW